MDSAQDLAGVRIGNLVVTLDETNPGLEFVYPDRPLLTLHWEGWLDSERMLFATRDPTRHFGYKIVGLKMGEWIEVFPNIFLKLYDPRGRVAVRAPREVKISRLTSFSSSAGSM